MKISLYCFENFGTFSADTVQQNQLDQDRVAENHHF